MCVFFGAWEKTRIPTENVNLIKLRDLSLRGNKDAKNSECRTVSVDDWQDLKTRFDSSELRWAMLFCRSRAS